MSNTILFTILSKLAEALITEENIKAVTEGLLELIKGKETQEALVAIEELKTAPSTDMLEYVGNVLEKESDLAPDQYAKVLLNKVTIA